MNLSFMETVWWVFKQLHDKGLVYRGFKATEFTLIHTHSHSFTLIHTN